MQYLTIGNCHTKHVADIHDLMVQMSVDNLLKGTIFALGQKLDYEIVPLFI
jgi:hypothetical protein